MAAKKKKKINVNVIKEVLNGEKTMKNHLIESALNNLLYVDDENREERVGMHGSGVATATADFCYRQQVLSFYFKGKEQEIPIKLKRIFLEGWYIHEKWQKIFMDAGVGLNVEQRGHSKDFQLLFTPDAIVKLNGITYVVEIKSVNTYTFKKLNSHPSGEKQLQLYMHMTGIPHGFVLCEDKNTQDIKVFYHEYDPIKGREYAERMHKVVKFKEIFEKQKKLPKKICPNPDCKKAKWCAYRDACFNIERIPLASGAVTGSKATKATVKQ